MHRAIALGLSRQARVTALHVVDPWLKQFHNEIYAQGRRRYLEYVEECLEEAAERVRREFGEMCRARGLHAECKFRRGEPMEEILDEVRVTAPDLLMTGSKRLSAWARFRSGNLPLRLRKRVGGQTTLVSVGSEMT